MWRRFLSGISYGDHGPGIHGPGAWRDPQPLSARLTFRGMRLAKVTAGVYGWAGDGHKSLSQMPDGAKK
jgi:hypothetical protein